jgi:pimeloyl-ACP methyl ester carboxylesterase
VGGSTGDYFQSTYDDIAADAWNAFQFLASRSEIDRSRIGLLGHSQGTAIATLTASKHPEIAFLILLAGLGLPAEEALEGQAVALTEARGGSAEAINKVRKEVRQIARLILDQAPLDSLRKELKVMAEAGSLRAGAMILGADDIESQVALYSSPWYLSQFTYRPAEVLPQIRCPVLALTGTLDPILPAAQNLLGLHKGLVAAKNPDITIVQLPGINHMLQTAKTGLPIEYSSLEETVSPRVQSVVTDWLKARFTNK